jgi:hypothetical protein
VSEGLRSGQIAEAAGVNVQTLRYYERRGLLAEPERSNGGHRLYGEEAVTALSQARRLQAEYRAMAHCSRLSCMAFRRSRFGRAVGMLVSGEAGWAVGREVRDAVVGRMAGGVRGGCAGGVRRICGRRAVRGPFVEIVGR